MKGFFVALGLIVLTSCANEAEIKGNLQLTGTVKGLRDGKLFIKKIDDTLMVALDTITISGDSSFKSDLEIDSPQMLYIELDRGITANMDDRLMFFAEPGAIGIETTLKHFYADAKVTGSKNHDLYEEYVKVKSRFSGQELDLTKEQMEASMGKNKEVDQKALDSKAEAVLRKKYLHAINFAVNHADYEVAPYIALTDISDAGLKYLDTINSSLSPKVKLSKYGKLLGQYVEERRRAEVK